MKAAEYLFTFIGAGRGRGASKGRGGETGAVDMDRYSAEKHFCFIRIWRQKEPDEQLRISLPYPVS